MAINYKQCLKCGSTNTLKIAYGEPTFEMIQRAEAGEIHLGGCCIMIGGPEYYCKNCDIEWNKALAVDAAYEKIQGLKASVGGFFGGYYNIEIDLITHQVSWIRWIGGEEETLRKTIRPATAKMFLEDLKVINLLNWKAEYIEPGVLDGTQWSVEILRDGRNLKKNGDNKFPDEWDAFCRLISTITGKKFS